MVLVSYHVNGFYLPGVAPKEFKEGQRVPVLVNKLTSVKTQLPFEYYSLPVCKPETVDDSPENLGEYLAGDTIESSGYELSMERPEECKVLCKKDYTQKEVDVFKKMIDEEYRVHWIIDNLPLAVEVQDQASGFTYYEDGFPVGLVQDSQYYLYNHIRFKINYHKNANSFDGARVVGFFVEPLSIKHTAKGDSVSCSGSAIQTIGKSGVVYWTYGVEWIRSNIPWASRWDVYLNSNAPDDKIHWFSIVNSLMIVLFLSGMIAMIMMRTLHRDISRYNEDPGDDAQEEFGWKLVHGDVFRPPQNFPMMLSVFAGTGVQILTMTMALLAFALLGFLSPANRGGLMNAMLLLFVAMGYFAGFVSARIYKMFGGKQWKQTMLMTAFLYPGTAFTIFFIVNLFIWRSGSSGAVKFTTMFTLLILWFGISVPLCAMGSFAGFKKDEIKNPTRYNQIPRQIPDQPFYMSSFMSVFVGGILPFGAVFIELFFIMSSIWLHQVYYVFGFLALVILILCVTCAEITIVLCYFHLCSEDYNWWWRSFLTSGSSAFYLFMYSILYYSTKLELRGVGSVIYFSYMGLIALSFFLMTGTVGFLSSLWFVRTIYGAIKID